MTIYWKLILFDKAFKWRGDGISFTLSKLCFDDIYTDDINQRHTQTVVAVWLEGCTVPTDYDTGAEGARFTL